MRDRARIWAASIIALAAKTPRAGIISILAAAIALSGYNLCKIPGTYAMEAQTESIEESIITCEIEETSVALSGAMPVITHDISFSRVLAAKYEPEFLVNNEVEWFVFASELNSDAEDHQEPVLEEEESNDASEQSVEPATGAEVIRVKNKSVNTLLDKKGAGYEVVSSHWPNSQWGTADTIATIKRLGEEWVKYGYGPVGIMDISLEGGGEMSKHDSHQKGVDVDILLMSQDGIHGTNIYDTENYSRDITRLLIQAILATGDVKFILFNDKVLIEEFNGIIVKADKHDNHLHVRYR